MAARPIIAAPTRMACGLTPRPAWCSVTPGFIVDCRRPGAADGVEPWRLRVSYNGETTMPAISAPAGRGRRWGTRTPR